MKNHKLHILILLILILLVSIFVVSNIQVDQQNLQKQINWGVSYDPTYAVYLGLDPKATYLAILYDLNTKSVRLSALWDRLEVQKDNFDFSELDWYVNEAQKHQTKVLLAIGYKLPRWPECRKPEWLKNPRERQLKMLEAVIKHYEKDSVIWAYQLENEPLLNFGLCPPSDREFLQKEVTFVRSLTKKPIIISDSGELRPWVTPMKLSDIFGTTLYRVVENPLIGQFVYPLKPWFYRIKSDLVRQFFAPYNQKTIVVELQAETWSNQTLPETPLDVQLANFSLQQFKDTVNFAQKTGFDEIYLWGVEWWYYLQDQGHPEYLNFAKTLF